MASLAGDTRTTTPPRAGRGPPPPIGGGAKAPPAFSPALIARQKSTRSMSTVSDSQQLPAPPAPASSGSHNPMSAAANPPEAAETLEIGAATAGGEAGEPKAEEIPCWIYVVDIIIAALIIIGLGIYIATGKRDANGIPHETRNATTWLAEVRLWDVSGARGGGWEGTRPARACAAEGEGCRCAAG